MKFFDRACFRGFAGLDGECEATSYGACAEHTREITEWAFDSCWTACYWWELLSKP